MDLIAHMVYGATACSRSGAVGGRKGSSLPWYREKTVWWSACIGILPDLASMGIPFVLFILRGSHGNFFRDIDPSWLSAYRYSHSLVTAAILTALMTAWRRSLFLPSLAYALHVVTDAVTHSGGKFHAPLFYPLFTWTAPGVAWWRHPEVVACYWAVPVAAWIFLAWLRRHATAREA